VAEKLKLKDDQVAEINLDDLQQRMPTGYPQADQKLLSGMPLLDDNTVDHLKAHQMQWFTSQLDFPIEMESEFTHDLSQFDPSFEVSDLGSQNPALSDTSNALNFNNLDDLSAEEINDMLQDFNGPEWEQIGLDSRVLEL
jgi:hypothetical protein